MVDASAGPVDLTLHLEVADDLAGIQWCQLGMSSPSAGQSLARLAFAQDAPLDVVLEATATLPQHAESGNWSMTYVICTDNAGNSVQLSHSDPLPFPLPSFTVVSAADVTPPALLGVSVSPAAVDASQGPVTMTLRFDATDDRSGVAWCQLGMHSPSEGQHLARLVLAAGAPLAAVLEGTVELPQFAGAGEWRMSYHGPCPHRGHPPPPGPVHPSTRPLPCS